MTENIVEIGRNWKKKTELRSFNYDLKINYKYQNNSMLKCFITFPAITNYCLNSVSIESIIWLLFQSKERRVFRESDQNHLDLVS